MRSGLVAVDRLGRIAALNEGAQRILGCPDGPAAAALGRDCREALGAQATLCRLLLEALDGRERPGRAELVLEPAAGRPGRTIGFTLGAVRDEEGGVQGAALVFRDLTPFERMDEQERLHERLAALGTMAAGLAHEIRNPLAGMEVIAGLLRRRLEGRSDELSLLAELTGELRSLADTVSASLEFVRPLAPVRAPQHVVALVEDALAKARARLPLELIVERDYETALPLLALDGEQLHRALVDLLVNALEAMRDEPEGGRRLRLSVRRDVAERAIADAPWAVDDASLTETTKCASTCPALVIGIDDNGPGVAPDLRERIFYPFFTTKQRGSGVGLAMAQKVVASHGGSLALEPTRGRGARFRLRLPLDGPGGLA
jgi:signal transduction histidine kinase